MCHKSAYKNICSIAQTFYCTLVFFFQVTIKHNGGYAQKNMATPLQKRKCERAGNSSCVLKASTQIPAAEFSYLQTLQVISHYHQLSETICTTEMYMRCLLWVTLNIETEESTTCRYHFRYILNAGTS